MNVEEFTELVGREPELDDLERANCRHAGAIGHFHCGICSKCKRPRFVCGHNEFHKPADPDVHDNTIYKNLKDIK